MHFSGIGHRGHRRFDSTSREAEPGSIVGFGSNWNDLVPLFDGDHPEELEFIQRQRFRGYNRNLSTLQDLYVSYLFSISRPASPWDPPRFQVSSKSEDRQASTGQRLVEIAKAMIFAV